MSQNENRNKPSPQEIGQFNGLIRYAQHGDIVPLRPILETWIRWEGKIIRKEVEGNLANIQKSINGEIAAKFLVAESTTGEVIGTIGFTPPDERLLSFANTERPIELINAYVSKEHRAGKGVGTALVKQVEEESLALGYTEVILNSGPRYKDTGWGFYDKIGYSKAGIARRYYGFYDAPVWRKKLQSS
jgi:ribosomal protein S18 acetylase RimI-like enzyme